MHARIFGRKKQVAPGKALSLALGKLDSHPGSALGFLGVEGERPTRFHDLSNGFHTQKRPTN